VRTLCSEVDIAFICGDGWLASHLRHHGCRDIRYAPLSTDERFPLQPCRNHYDYDLVLIGNHIRSRLPFKTMPGALLRRRLVDYFERRLGSRFGVFGYGWSGSSAGGTIDYEDQGEVYASGFAALGCNNWFTPYYFSDRLPIMMSSGRPAIHYCDEGYGEVFGVDPGTFWFRDLDEAWRQFHVAMDDPDETQRAVLRAHDLAVSRFTTYRVLAYMVTVLDAHAEARATGGPVSHVANPWIAADRL